MAVGFRALLLGVWLATGACAGPRLPRFANPEPYDAGADGGAGDAGEDAGE